MTATSPLGNEVAAGALHGREFVVAADVADPRVSLFQQALASAGLAPARIIGWRQIADGQVEWDRELTPGCVLRIDSPGRDFGTYCAILRMGVAAATLSKTR
jgi:hypothetical protein